MNAKFLRKTEEAKNITTFYFKPDRPLDFVPGQFTRLSLPHEDQDDRGHKRWFTLSSTPRAEHVAITTKFTPAKSSSFKKAMLALKPGTEVQLESPMGDFVLPKDPATPLIFVAAGIGLTPFHSMLDWLAENHQTRPIKFLYAVRSEDDIIFQETFTRAGVHVTIVVSQPSPAWGGESGHLTAEMILGLEHPSDDTLIYMSGPKAQVVELETALKEAGISSNQLILDFFPGYTSA